MERQSGMGELPIFFEHPECRIKITRKLSTRLENRTKQPKNQNQQHTGPGEQKGLGFPHRALS